MFKPNNYVYVKGLPASKPKFRNKKGIAKIVSVGHFHGGYFVGSASYTYYGVRFLGEEFVFRAYEDHLRALTPKEKKAVKFVEYLKPVHISPFAPK